jgi:MFS family permease
MTALGGASQTHWQLLLARTGVGIGEAGGMAPSQAMISDLYPPGERAAAQAALSAGINAGAFFSFLLGGYVGQRYGWRVAFMCAGALTVALALLLRVTIGEPERMAARLRGAAVARPSRAIVGETLRAMCIDPVLRQLCIGAALTASVAAGTATWAPSYLARSHGMGIAAIGLYLAVVLGLGGALGTWLGGLWSDRLRRRDVRWSLWLVAVLSMATKPLSIGFYLAADTRTALLLFLLPGMTTAVFLGPSIAVLHDRVSPHLQPVASAMLALLMSLIGLGLGPLFVGVMSDWAFAAHRASSLRYALVVLQIAGIWGALHFYAAGRHLGQAHAA